MSDTGEIRPCAVCGMFYPGNSDELKQDLAALLDAVGAVSPGGAVRGLIVPHAGYLYSGGIAAEGYARLKGAAYDAVVVVSPSHRQYFEGVSVFPGGGYATPLGTVPVAGALRDELLAKCPAVSANVAGHRDEHAIEVQLPFLQHILGNVPVLPLVIGSQTPDICFELGNALGALLARFNILLIASTDLSHYHPGDMADLLDQRMIEHVRALDARGLMTDLAEGKTEACGGGPAVAVMTGLRNAGLSSMTILRHGNSGDVTGDYRSVVGYLAAAGMAGEASMSAAR